MGITKMIITYGMSVLAFAGIDAIWLQKVAPALYRENIGHLLADRVNVSAAVLFYAIFLVGLVAFVISPALQKGSLAHALGYGALFGLVTYATFDLTCQAVMKSWPVRMTIIDISWGIFLSATVSVIVYVAARKLFYP